MATSRSLPQSAAPLGESLALPRAGERRNLTVMFCDLVGSTALAERLDPEDWQQLVRAYHAACTRTILAHGGHVAQYLGDGVLAYFGYPRAHENNAERAVRAGLQIVDEVGRLDATGPLAARGARLSLRVGIHAGLVVIGADDDDVDTDPSLAFGHTVNVAARLQAIAAPDSVVVSDAVMRRASGLLVTESLGPHDLPGISAPLAVHRVHEVRPAVPGGSATPLVARQREIDWLLDRWEVVRERRGQVVLLSGEAGIGKSRLARALRDGLADDGHTWLEGHCAPTREHSPFFPVIDLLRHWLDLDAGAAAASACEKLAHALRQASPGLDEALPFLAELLGLPLTRGGDEPRLSVEEHRQRLLGALTACIVALAERRPITLVIEDLHWVDPSTLDLLGMLVEQAPSASLLVVLTFRPDFRPPWTGRSHVSLLTLAQLTRAQTRAMIAHLTSGVLTDDVVEQIAIITDGVPLYVEELTRALVEAQDPEAGAAPAVAPTVVPSTLQDSLMARLDRLGQAKPVAQIGAVLGRHFSEDLLGAVAAMEPAALAAALRQLVEAEFLARRGVSAGATYVFRHVLVQETAYQSLLKRTRRHLHGRVARVLVEAFPESAAAEPEVVAWHAEAGGLLDVAVTYYRRAATQASVRSAHEEAIGHLKAAIRSLTRRPATAERNEQEAALLMAVGSALVAARGAATEHADRCAQVVGAADGDSRSARRRWQDWRTAGSPAAR